MDIDTFVKGLPSVNDAPDSQLASTSEQDGFDKSSLSMQQMHTPSYTPGPVSDESISTITGEPISGEQEAAPGSERILPTDNLTSFVNDLPSLHAPELTEDEKVNSVRSITLANAFNMPLDMAVMHDEQLWSAVKNDPKLKQHYDNVWQAWKESYQEGYKDVNESLWYHRLIIDPSDQEALAAIKSIEDDRNLNKQLGGEKEPANIAQDFIASAGRLAPFMAEGFKYGATRGAILAGGAGLASAATGLGLPAAGPLAAGMYAVGQVSGITEFAYKAESGAALKEMYNFTGPDGEKIDQSISRAAATGIGVLNSAVETLQVSQAIKMIPGGEKLLSGAIRKVGTDLIKKRSFQNLLTNVVAKYGSFVGLQTLEEVAQESITIAGVELAKEITSQLEGKNLPGITPEQVGERIKDTFVESAKGFAVMGLAGVPGNALSYSGNQQMQERGAAAEQNEQKGDVAEEEQAFDNPALIGDFAITEEEILQNDKLVEQEVNEQEIEEFVNASQARKVELANGWINRTRYNQVKNTISESIGEDKADAAMQLFEARAAAAGLDSAEVYLESRGISASTNQTAAGFMQSLEDGTLYQKKQSSPVELQTTPATVEQDGVVFETGRSVTFTYSHNTESATKIFGKPDKESPYGRGYEPSGKYMVVIPDNSGPSNIKTIEQGTVTFNNPLVIDAEGLGWKKKLSDSYGGLTGKNLSKAVIADGYDGIVTVDNGRHASEVVDFTSFDEKKALYQGANFAEIDTTSPEFRGWFSDSKVVDEKGLPLVVYHGTATGDFSQFDTGYNGMAWFTSSSDYANAYATADGERQRVYPVYLSINNPVDLGFRDSQTEVKQSEVISRVKDKILDQFGREQITKDTAKSLVEELNSTQLGADNYLQAWEWIRNEELASILKRAGFDGLLTNEGKNGGASAFAVFSPSQIKSATSNTGKFSSTDARINYQGEVNPKGATVFQENEQIIHLFETADFSTVVHEIGHIFRRDLDGDALALAESWAGVEDGQWSVENEEKFARAFERYLRDGQAPSAELKTVFAKFREWLKEIYKTLAGSSINIEITDDIKQVFDGLLDSDSQEEQEAEFEFQEATVFKPYSLFQAGEQDLFAVHNLSAENLKHADKMGGLAVPSIAISRTSTAGFESFGEISLIADKKLIDPRESKTSKVFNADIYSPRYPKIEFKINRSKLNRAWDKLGESSEKLGYLLSSELDDSTLRNKGIGAFYESSVVKYEYLQQMGKAPKLVFRKKPVVPKEVKAFAKSRVDLANDPGFKEAARKHYHNKINAMTNGRLADKLKDRYFDENGDVIYRLLRELIDTINAARKPKEVDLFKMKQAVHKKIEPRATTDAFKEWVVDNFADTLNGDAIRDGYTYSGNPKYLTHDLDTVVRLMKKGLQDGEGHSYGLGSLRSNVAQQFKSVKAIQDERLSIVDQETFEAIKEEAEDEFSNLAEELKPFYKYESEAFGYYDQVSEALKGLATMGMGEFGYYFEAVPDDLLADVKDFLGKLRTMPTEYFEAKLQRVVGLNEFKYAIVPKGTSKSVKDVLKSHGLTVRLYDKNKKRVDVVSTLKNILFQEDIKDPGYGELEQGATYPLPDKYLIDEYNEMMAEATRKGEVATEKRFADLEAQLKKSALKTAKEMIKDHPVLSAMDEAVKRGGLSYDQLSMDYGPGTLAELARKRPGITSRKNNLSPDEFAADSGFDTLDDMIEAFLSAPLKGEYLDELALDVFEEQIRYDQEARDALTDEYIAEATSKALDEMSVKPDRAFSKQLKGIIREQSGQTRRRSDQPTVTEYEAYIYALSRSAQAAKKAQTEGNKAGVAKENARMKAIVARMKAKQKLQGSRRELKRKIVRALRTSKMNKGRSRFGPEAQDILDFMRTAINTTNVKLEEQIDALLSPYNNLASSVPLEVKDKVEMLDSALRFGTMSEQELFDMLRNINDFKESNRDLMSAKLQAQKDIWAEERLHMSSLVYGENGRPAGLETSGEFEPSGLERLRQMLKNTALPFLGWKDLLDVLSFADKSSKANQSWISKRFDLLETKNQEKAGVQAAMKSVADAAKQIYGLKSEYALQHKFIKDSVVQELGIFRNLDGVNVPIKLSRAQARKRVMELLDPSLTEKFVDDMRWTPEIVKAIRGFLSKQDEEFIAWQMEFYQQYYEGINTVYRELTGSNLPKNDFYSPLSVHHGGKQEESGGLVSDFLKDVGFRAKVKAGGTIARTVHSNPIALNSDIIAFQRHIAEMEHYKAYGPTIRDFQSVMLDQGVQQAIRLTYGKAMVDTLDFFLREFAEGGAATAKALGWLDVIRGNVVRSTLALKPVLTLKQLSSFPAYFDAVPVKDAPILAKYMTEFWLHPVRNVRFLKESSIMFSTRGDNMERDIKTAASTPIIKGWKANPSFLNTLMANIHIGDQGAIAWGGWAYYKYLVDKKGYTHEEAINAFESFSESTQQSADKSEQSVVQQGNSLQKLLTMYQSSPIQYFRKEISALRNLAAGRATAAETAKTLVIFHVILPVLFQLISDRFEWEEDDQMRAIILGPLNSIVFIGEGLSHVVGRIIGTKFNDMELPIYAPFKDLGKAILALTGDNISNDDVAKAVRSAAGFTGSVTGLPAKQVVDFSGGVYDVIDGETEKGITKILGWSPYIAEEVSK